MISCLNQQELGQLLKYKIFQSPIDEDLAYSFNHASEWSKSIGILTYLLARELENCIVNNRNEGANYIEVFYNLEKEIYVEIQEIDRMFILALLNTIRCPSLTIEEELVELQTRIMNHEYNKVIRYRH